MTSEKPTANMSPVLGMTLTIAMVVVVREVCVQICHYFSIENAGNVMGLVVMFIILFGWRLLREHNSKPSLPDWMTNASNKLLVDSGFAFLPISAGAGILLFSMQDEFWGVVATMLISTLLPMWALAKLGDVWLAPTGKEALIKADSNKVHNTENHPADTCDKHVSDKYE